jgi:hypothetical protein
MPLICSPPIAPSISNKTICENTATTLTSAGIGTLSWYSDSIGGNYLGSGLSFNTPTLTNTTNYYVQDSTCAASTRAKVTVFILPKPKIGFTLNNINQCVNTNLVFTDTSTMSQGNINRLWKLNNLDTSTSINFTKKFNSAGSFTIQLIVANSLNSSCKDSLSKAFNIYPKPNVSINANATVICQGQTITLRGNGAKTYNWNNNIINNEPFKPTVNTSYKVIGIDSNGCVDSAFINVVVNLNPSASIQATENPVCAKTPIKLTASGGNLYFWSDGIINGQSFVPVGSKTYNVTVFDDKGCSDTASIKLDVKPSPNVEITKNKAVLTATLSGANYQWINCYNKTIIVGATNQTYTALSNGNYSVIIIQNGCRDTSTCINVNTIGLNEINFDNLSIFPNPAKNKINLVFEGIVPKNTTAHIYDSKGSLVKSETMMDNEINITNLAQGLYLINIESEGKRYSSKFIKE